MFLWKDAFRDGGYVSSISSVYARLISELCVMCEVFKGTLGTKTSFVQRHC